MSSAMESLPLLDPAEARSGLTTKLYVKSLERTSNVISITVELRRESEVSKALFVRKFRELNVDIYIP